MKVTNARFLSERSHGCYGFTALRISSVRVWWVEELRCGNNNLGGATARFRKEAADSERLAPLIYTLSLCRSYVQSSPHIHLRVVASKLMRVELPLLVSRFRFPGSAVSASLHLSSPHHNSPHTKWAITQNSCVSKTSCASLAEDDISSTILLQHFSIFLEFRFLDYIAICTSFGSLVMCTSLLVFSKMHSLLYQYFSLSLLAEPHRVLPIL